MGTSVSPCFKVTDKGTFGGEMSENDKAIREQLKKWGDK
jgi:hypothetical protein